MIKDQIMKSINNLLPAERMEIAIEILLGVMNESGISKNEPILVQELKDTLLRLGKGKK